jgi:hypothetical protein
VGKRIALKGDVRDLSLQHCSNKQQVQHGTVGWDPSFSWDTHCGDAVTLDFGYSRMFGTVVSRSGSSSQTKEMRWLSGIRLLSKDQKTWDEDLREG